MKAADLQNAQTLIEQRDALLRIEGRLAAGAKLHLVLGEGSEASEIILAATYLERVRSDVQDRLGARVQNIESQLRGMGVEP